MTLADVPIWIAALVGILGLVGSFLRQQRSWHREAVKVAVWTDRLNGQLHALVKNGSEIPIHHALITYGEATADNSGLHHFWLGLVPAGETAKWNLEESSAITLTCWAEPTVEVRFSNASNRHWLRDENGRLERHKHEAIPPYDERSWPLLRERGEDRLLHGTPDEAI